MNEKQDLAERISSGSSFQILGALNAKLRPKYSVDLQSQAAGHPQLHKKLAVLTLMKALMVAVLWQSL